MSLKIVFMGTSTFAVPILESIYNTSHTILEVYTQPPKKKNRGQKIKNSPIHDFANKLKLPVRCPESFKDNNEIDYIKSLNPDLIVVVAYGKIFPEKLLNLNNLLFINIHASLLPKWRGAAPIQRAIMNMDKETGISIMKIVPKNKVNFINQDESQVSYAHKIEKTESKINWNENADKISAKIRAFYPNPGCWFTLNNIRIKVIKAAEVELSGKVGTIIDDKLIVACKKNALQILELQKEGKKEITIDDYLRGNQIKIGQILS